MSDASRHNPDTKQVKPAVKRKGTHRTPPNAGKGRKPGSQNKVTKALKEQILGALEAKDGQAWFEARMDDQPAAFMALLGKILPSEMTATLQNPDGGPFSITVRFVKPTE